MTGPARFLIPLGLALAAGAANFVILKRQAARVEVLVAAVDVAEGEALTADKLSTLVVRADERVFPHALKRENLGEIDGLTARRRIRAGEVLFRADVQESVQAPAAGEHTWSVNARVDHVAPLLVPGQSVFVYLMQPDAAGSASRAARGFGPYRLLGWQPYQGQATKEPARQYVFAVPDRDPQESVARAWLASARNSLDVVQAIELAPSASRK
jgi:hypothetical protein